MCKTALKLKGAERRQAVQESRPTKPKRTTSPGSRPRQLICSNDGAKERSLRALHMVALVFFPRRNKRLRWRALGRSSRQTPNSLIQRAFRIGAIALIFLNDFKISIGRALAEPMTSVSILLYYLASCIHSSMTFLYTIDHTSDQA